MNSINQTQLSAVINTVTQGAIKQIIEEETRKAEGEIRKRLLELQGKIGVIVDQHTDHATRSDKLQISLTYEGGQIWL